MALARPSLTSLLTLLKLTLLILVPASISTHVIIAKLYTEFTGALCERDDKFGQVLIKIDARTIYLRFLH